MSNKPLDPFRCDGPGCTRSLRSVAPDAWKRLPPHATDPKSYTFCTTACALAFREQRKRTAMDSATERKALALMDAFLSPEYKAKIADVTARWAAWAADPEHNPMPRREVKALRGAAAPRLIDTPATTPEGILARARAIAEMTNDDTKATMVERAKAHLTVIALEHAYDPMPKTSDLTERIYWQQREDRRKMRAAQWEAYLG